jgi:hypothetical protein
MPTIGARRGQRDGAFLEEEEERTNKKNRMKRGGGGDGGGGGGEFKFTVLLVSPLRKSEIIHNRFRLYFLSDHTPNSSGDANKKRFYWQRQRGGGASFRSANAAQVCNNVVFLADYGVFECIVAIAARRIVSERW